MKPNESQLKKFWEWCGLNPTYQYESPAHPMNGVLREIDLNNLFKWAVPKLRKLGIAGSVLYVWLPKIIIDGEDPALALFWAINKVIEELK